MGNWKKVDTRNYWNVKAISHHTNKSVGVSWISVFPLSVSVAVGLSFEHENECLFDCGMSEQYIFQKTAANSNLI